MQVKKLLLQAVSEHDEIIKSARAKPNVLFQQFGDSAMIFQVWFLIKDFNKKANVRSDVNFTIDRLFREHQVKIAHPPRDIIMRTL
jgi:small-conductance mechanosensitive channel